MKSYSALFLLCSLVCLGTFALAARRCPNKCLRPKKKAVIQCSRFRSACTVKKCPKGRGWKCANNRRPPRPSPKSKGVACSPIPDPDVVEHACGNLGCSDIVDVKGDKRVFYCECADGLGSTGEPVIIWDGLSKRDGRCFVDCMTEKSCLRGVCTPSLRSGDVNEECSHKRDLLLGNVLDKGNLQACCEKCGGFLDVHETRFDDYFICTAP